MDDFYECGAGWHPLINRTVAAIKEIEPDIEFTQIKEKFGELRIYIYPHSDEAEAIIDRATAESLRTCETCGKPGKLRTGGWLATLCDEHA